MNACSHLEGIGICGDLFLQKVEFSYRWYENGSMMSATDQRLKAEELTAGAHYQVEVWGSIDGLPARSLRSGQFQYDGAPVK